MFKGNISGTDSHSFFTNHFINLARPCQQALKPGNQTCSNVFFFWSTYVTLNELQYIFVCLCLFPIFCLIASAVKPHMISLISQ